MPDENPVFFFFFQNFRHIKQKKKAKETKSIIAKIEIDEKDAVFFRLYYLLCQLQIFSAEDD